MKSPECYEGRAILANQVLLASGAQTATGTGTATEILAGMSALYLQLDLIACPAPIYSASVAAGADDGQHESGTLTTNATTIAIGRPIGSAADNAGIFRFDGVAIPAGATIISATLRLRRTADDVGSVPVLISLVDADDPAFPANAGAFEALSLTSGTSDTIASGLNGSDWTSADFKSDLQAVINRGGWASTNALIIVPSGNGGSVNQYATFAAYEHSTAPQAVLSVTYQSDTLDVFLQTIIDGTNWVDIYHFTQIVGNGNAKRYFGKVLFDATLTEFSGTAALAAGAGRAILGSQYRVRWAIADNSTFASFTFSVTANGT